MSVTERISEKYSIENTLVYERSLNGRLIAIRIEPNADYALCRTETVEGEKIKTYTEGFMQIPTSQIDAIISNLSTIPVDEIPEPEPGEEGVDI